MEITKAFSLRINELIDETGLSLENLSRAAGVSVFTLFHLKGQNNPKLPSTKVLLKLADYFKCSLSFMLGQEECNSLPSPKTELPAFSDRLRELIEAKELTQIFSYEKIGAEKGLSLHVQLAQRQVYTKRLQSSETGKTSRLLGGLSFGQGII